MGKDVAPYYAVIVDGETLVIVGAGRTRTEAFASYRTTIEAGRTPDQWPPIILTNLIALLSDDETFVRALESDPVLERLYQRGVEAGHRLGPAMDGTDGQRTTKRARVKP